MSHFQIQLHICKYQVSVNKQRAPSTYFTVRWFHLGTQGSGVTAWPHQIRLNWEKCLAQQKEVIWSTLNANESAMCKLQKTTTKASKKHLMQANIVKVVNIERRFQILAMFLIVQSILSAAGWILISRYTNAYTTLMFQVFYYSLEGLSWIRVELLWLLPSPLVVWIPNRPGQSSNLLWNMKQSFTFNLGSQG